MELTADMVYGFTQTILLSKFDDPKPTPKVHREWWKLACDESRYVAIAAPRGHAKSTAITHSFTLAAVLFRFRDYVLLISDTEGQAIQYLGDIKAELYENEELIKLFGIKRFVKDTETDIIVEFMDHERFRITVKGSEQKVRGLKWRGKRPNLIIGDDLENDEIVMNDERREKFRRWFFNALLPAGSDDCIVRIVGTILHLDSLLERLMPQIGAIETVDFPLKSVSRDKSRSWLSVRYRAHDETFEHILWPEKWPRARLEAERQIYIEQGNPEGYAQEYLNYPIDESTSYFRKNDFLPIDDMVGPFVYYSAADLAISEKDKSAFTVIATARMNPKGKLQVVDIRRFRGDSLEIVNELLSVHQRYVPDIFVLEKENIERSIGPFLKREMINRGIFLNIAEEVPSVDKIKRARSLQARMRAGQVEFDTKADWFIELQQEFLQFPRGRYKDQVDALSWIGLVLDKMIEAPTQAELDEEEYQLELQDSELGSGECNWITGY